MNVHESHALMLYILTKQKIEENIITLRFYNFNKQLIS